MSTAIVTGASSGLGSELAKRLNDRGHQVVLVARSASALESLASELNGALVVPADLATQEGRDAVVAACPSPDIVVNNAGFGGFGPFAESDPAMVQSMISVNCSALTALTQAYLPKMVAAGKGRILNIASTASFQPGPLLAVYCATKAYVLSFTEAVAEENRGSGVSITAFCPGAFASGFQEAAHAEKSRLVNGRKLPTSADIADEAMRALDGSQVVYVPGLFNKIGAQATRFVPRGVTRRMVSYIQTEK
jgi:short-subunit dehydrogenase